MNFEHTVRLFGLLDQRHLWVVAKNVRICLCSRLQISFLYPLYLYFLTFPYHHASHFLSLTFLLRSGNCSSSIQPRKRPIFRNTKLKCNIRLRCHRRRHRRSRSSNETGREHLLHCRRNRSRRFLPARERQPERCPSLCCPLRRPYRYRRHPFCGLGISNDAARCA
jgi:hypothetical protein